MTKKEETLIEWAKRVSADWKHIPSLKGKQAFRNLAILQILATSQTPKSVWDLALEFLKRTNPKFELWNIDKVYHERQKENAKMNRRLKFLIDKQYVRKIGSLCRLSAKGCVLLMVIDPKLVSVMPRSALNQDLCETKAPSIVEERDLNDVEIEGLKSLGVFNDPILTETISAMWKRLLMTWKINIDEIDETEFMNLLVSKFENVAKKAGIGKIEITKL